MIKKLVLLLLIVVGLYGSWTAFRQGYIGIQTQKFALKIDVPSYNNLKNNKSTMELKNSELNGLISRRNTAENTVKVEADNYQEKKKTYDDLTKSATREEIEEANKVEEYFLDYLWIKIGNYANDNDVKFKLTNRKELKCLDFDVTGSYISVINFIYDIQNDSQLKFNVNGIYIQGGSSDKVVKAKFTVENINVIESNNPDENITTGVILSNEVESNDLGGAQ